MSVWAVVLCGGSGERMGAKENKTLLPIGGMPGVQRCVQTLQSGCDGVVLVARAGDERVFSELLPDCAVVQGGADRQASVYNGLLALPEDCDIVLVHDGARPLVSQELVARVIDGVRARGAAVAATPIRDTVRRADESGRMLATIPRDGLYAMQTPQGFFKRDLLAAHENATTRETDDAALLLAQGVPVYAVAGDLRNIKLTTREDITLANTLTGGARRIGHGYDAHRLVAGRALMLGGVAIPYDKGLLGHSDADVAVHALMDALLGALALGDIGKLFPDTDARYKGISSLALLEACAARIRESGYRLENADVTIVAQAPKLAPHIASMRENIARAMKCDIGRVSVKATTTEGMGFEGRGEGISAHAVALLTT